MSDETAVKSCEFCGATIALYAMECPKCLHVQETSPSEASAF